MQILFQRIHASFITAVAKSGTDRGVVRLGFISLGSQAAIWVSMVYKILCQKASFLDGRAFHEA
jgi:hypothetical protein